MLQAACGGDEDAFRRLVEPYRSPLQAHCYRMLGSLHDAEDAVQDALLRAWRGLCGFDGRSALRTWLYRITTNACLDTIARRPKRVLPIDYATHAGADALKSGERLAESVRAEPYRDETLGFEDGSAAPEARFQQREAVGLAFAAALQRARKAVDERLPEEGQQPTIRSLDDQRVGEIVQLFTDAFERGDVHAIIGLLAEDATFAMPPDGRVAGLDRARRNRPALPRLDRALSDADEQVA